MNDSSETIQSIIQFYEKKLDSDLGYCWWKRYVSAALWSNISTPINLAITLLTAVTTGQAASKDLLSDSLYFKISVITLLISTLNTFFKPHNQMSINIDAMKKIAQIGNKFEKVFYTEARSNADLEKKLSDYKSIHEELINYKNEEDPKNQNFFSDLIHYLVLACGLKRKDNWLELDKESIKNWESLSKLLKVNVVIENKENKEDKSNEAVKEEKENEEV
jgi:hypothetical protein